MIQNSTHLRRRTAGSQPERKQRLKPEERGKTKENADGDPPSDRVGGILQGKKLVDHPLEFLDQFLEHVSP